MTSIPAPGSAQYFVGVNGQQNGPFSETQLVDQIRTGKIPQDALVWFEGMSEWQSIKVVPVFRDAFDAPPGAIPSPQPAPQTAVYKPSSGSAKASVKVGSPAEGDRDTSFFASGTSSAGPVFDKSESLFSTAAMRNRKMKRMVLIGGGLTLFAALILVFRFTVVGNLDFANGVKLTNHQVTAPQFTDRESALRTAHSELLLKPQESLVALKKLIEQNPSDEIGKQALDMAVEYYKTHAPKEAGAMMLTAKRPAEAVPFFLMDPPDVDRAQAAYETAAKEATDAASKKKFLVERIKLLLGPGNNPALATDALKELEKVDASAVAPFSYYLKSSEAKMADLFSRISFYYVQTLLAYMDTEMPQIKFEKRPLVEIKRDKANMYRIVASYNGEVLLNRDRMQNINFEFWLAKGRWVLVKTNLTEERAKFVAADRTKLIGEVQTKEDMLRNLEQTFRTQFPKTPVHERPSEKKADLED